MSDTNRVQDKIDQWAATHPKHPIFRAAEQEERLEFLDRLKKAFGETKDPSERKSLAWVDSEIKRTTQLLKPDLFERLFSRFADLLHRADHWIGKQFLGKKEELILPSDLTPKWAPTNLTLSEKEDKFRLLINFIDSKNRLGLPGHLTDEAITKIYSSAKSFSMENKAPLLGEHAKLKTFVEQSPDSGRYYATGYDLTTYRDLTPQVKEANGVNVADLTAKMESISWKNDYSKANNSILSESKENQQLLGTVNGVFNDLSRLLQGNDPAARRVHDQLAVRFFADTPNAVLVPNMDEIRKEFEHKIHVKLGANDEFSLRPSEAMMLLNRGVVNLDRQNDGLGQPWLTIKDVERDANGFYQVQPIEGSERFSIRAALAEANVISLGKQGTDEENIQRLLKGESIQAVIEQNGQKVERFIQADPAQQRIAIDWIRSENSGLFQRDAQLALNLDRYVGQQQGTYQAPVIVPSENIVQSALWTTKAEINGNNLSSLEKQLADMGVQPSVAKEVLDRTAGSDEPYYQHPYRQEYGEDIASSQLRFRKDTDTNWVHYVGFDMKATVGTEHKEVNQRYYYNPDDPSNNYTLSEAYRMATGNAVSKMIPTPEGTQEVWRSLGFDQEKTPKGNHQILSTPFDLDKAWSAYPHREDIVRNLAPGQSLETLSARARQGEDVHFSLTKNGVTEVLNLKINPKENSIMVLRLPGNGTENQSKQTSQSTGKNLVEKETTGVKQSL